ncbi:MAG: hypothetical protein AAGF12_16395 [Myxococcota bacterium]
MTNTLRTSLLLTLCALTAMGCPIATGEEPNKDDDECGLTQPQAQACISVATDPDQAVMGSFDVKRLTNTCACDINVAFSVTDGRPTPDAPELPNLSQGEWTRAFITQGSNGEVAYYACASPLTVDTSSWATDGSASCTSP